MNKRASLATALLIASIPAALAGRPTTEPPASTGPTPISQCQSISQPGSYVLTTNLSSSGDCLVVAANSVSIDLAGFTISGSGSGSGIARVQGTAQEGNSVRNGTITGFNRGVDFQFTQRCVIENVHVTHNTEFGIISYDGCHIVSNNTFANGTGIFTDDGSVVINNIVRGNTYDGLVVGGLGSIAKGNTATVNQHNGIVAYSHSTLIGNIVYASGSRGFEIECPSNLIENTVTNSGAANLWKTGVGCIESANLFQ